MNTYSSLKVDKFSTSLCQHLSLSYYVIFIDNGNQEAVINCIRSNYSAIQQAFESKGKRFILWSEIVGQSSNLEPLKYFYPRLTKYSDLDDLELLSFESIKRCLGYNGNITTGLLSIGSTCEFIQFESNSVIDFKQLLDCFFSNIYVPEYDEMPFLPYESDIDINLDEETGEAINIIFDQFNSLIDNGNFLQVLPIIERYLKTQNTAQLGELSILEIDEDFNIFLKDYNLEINLSHLTKSIYLLFLNHPEGILLTELKFHRKELLEYYKNISNRINLDKMSASVDDLINAGSNAIYVHLSRIKSAFSKALNYRISQYYIIDGGKNKPKKIDLRSDLIIWGNPIGNTSEIDYSRMDIDE